MPVAVTVKLAAVPGSFVRDCGFPVIVTGVFMLTVNVIDEAVADTAVMSSPSAAPA